MARPVKLRKIEGVPEHRYFKPSGVSIEELEELVLKVEEVEAMRLKDVEGLHQEDCANRMKVSRQTFQIILDRGRSKVARAISEGKALRIDGGNYTLNICHYKCGSCGHEYEIGYEDCERICPECGSKEVGCQHGDEFCNSKCERC